MVKKGVSLKEIRGYTGISEATLSRWQQQELIVRGDSLSEVIKSIVDYYKKLLRDKQEVKNKDALYQEKVRETAARADKIEVENQVTAGQLLVAEDVEKFWSKYILSCRSRLLSIPSKLSLELSGLDDPNEIHKILQQEVYQALEELGEKEQ